MNVLELLTIGDVVDFAPYSPTLGSYKSVKVKSILDYKDAIALGLDAPAMHAKVFPSLPIGAINDYRKYSYLRIEHLNGTFECIGVPWINPATINVKASSKITVVFENVGPGDVEKIRQMSVINGYVPQITIE